MTLPKGIIWQQLRQQGLSAVPAGTVLPYKAPTSLAAWQSTGTYLVSVASTKRFTIIAPSVDVGAALLSEAEYLLDHAAEQQADLLAQLKMSAWASPAWQVVGFYYWAYYLAMAITRMLGNTVWFVDAEVALQLSRLAPSGSPNAGAGTFRVQCGATVSATERELLLTKSSGRVHDQLWKVWAGTVDAALTGTRRGAGNATEERFYTAQQRINRALSPEWPSKLRNLVNYRPGYGYCAVRKTGVLESLRYIDSAATALPSDLIQRLETNALAIQTGIPLQSQAKRAIRLLIDFTFLMHATARDLHAELILRNGIDRRWLHDRHSFVRQWCTLEDDAKWPC